MTVFDKWQTWRNADQADSAILSRHEIIVLLAEIERLRAALTKITELKYGNQSAKVIAGTALEQG